MYSLSLSKGVELDSLVNSKTVAILKQEIEKINNSYIDFVKQQNKKIEAIKELIEEKKLINSNGKITYEEHKALQEIKQKEHQIENLNIETINYRKYCDTKISKINAWIETQEYSSELNNPSLISKLISLNIDADIFDILRIKLKEAYPNEEEKSKQILEMFNSLITTVREREVIIQNIFISEKQIKLLINKLLKKIENLEFVLKKLDVELNVAKNEYNQLQMKEKVMIQVKEEKQTQVEFSLKQLSEMQFSKYIKDNQEVFKEVKRTYGNKIAKKIIEDYKNDFKDKNNKEMIERKTQIKNIYNELCKINKYIETFKSEYSPKLMNLIVKAKEEINVICKRISILQNQLSAALDAETEIANEISSYLNKKKDELTRVISSFYAKKNMDYILKKVEDIKGIIDNNKLSMDNVEKDIENHEKLCFDKKTNYSLSKAQYQMRIDNTKKHLNEIENSLKPSLKSLQREILNYKIQIYKGQKKKEYLEGKLSQNQVNMELTKTIFGDKIKPGQEMLAPTTRSCDINVENFLGSVAQESILQSYETQLQIKNSVQALGEQSARNIYVSEKYPILEMEKIEEVIKESPKLGKININISDITSNQVLIAPDPFTYSNFLEKNSKFKIKINECSTKESLLFESIKSFLDGVHIFKKHSTKTSYKGKTFDPLNAHIYKPEDCGYGSRTLYYNKYKNRLEFKSKEGKFPDSYISVWELKSTIIPQHTSQIIKAQKMSTKVWAEKSEVNINSTYEEEYEEVLIDKINRYAENESFRNACTKVKHYEFSLTTGNERFEFLVEGYNAFKYIISGLKQLISTPSDILYKFNKKIKPTRKSEEDEEEESDKVNYLQSSDIKQVPIHDENKEEIKTENKKSQI